MGDALIPINTTALVLGYFVLILFISGLAWLLSVRLEAWRYHRKRMRKHDREWDNLRSAWIFEDRKRAMRHNEDRLNTDILDFTVEQIYGYQKEHSDDPA